MKINVEIVTPTELVFSSDVEMVVVPGSEGDFGVMAQHSPMVASLRPGVIDIYESGNQISKQIFINDGFAEVNQERCTILATEFTDVTNNPEKAVQLVKCATETK